MTTPPVVAFVSARLDEEEEDARKAEATVLPPGFPRETYLAYGLERAGFGLAYQGFALIHDPARVLREVAAKRAILAAHAPETPSKYGSDVPRCTACLTYREGWHEDWNADAWPCRTVRHVAAIWNDHPAYDPAWAPDPA